MDSGIVGLVLPTVIVNLRTLFALLPLTLTLLLLLHLPLHNRPIHITTHSHPIVNKMVLTLGFVIVTYVPNTPGEVGPGRAAIRVEMRVRSPTVATCHISWMMTIGMIATRMMIIRVTGNTIVNAGMLEHVIR